jgi:hypothetical protein
MDAGPQVDAPIRIDDARTSRLEGTAEPRLAAVSNVVAGDAPPVQEPTDFGADMHRDFSTRNGHPPTTAEPSGAESVVSETAANEQLCTAPQLRRFIKSRAYVPMHELRRRFGINGGEDDVTRVDVEGEHVYVGLPGHEGQLLGELLRAGEVGYELSLDPRSPVIVGVYPIRPVPRH